ncbi:MAG: DNA-binding protein [Deltaproteobacteria bacterium]|nr:MAG: DNA-binding protein [Deltaproteobacteria bacterium]
MNKLISLCCSILLIIGLTACSQDKPKEQASTPQVTEQQPDVGMATAPPAPVTGKVLETMNASGYTYLNVETDTGTKWIAVNQTAVEVGEEVTFMDGMVMQNFFSKSLDRTFPEIVFSSGLVGKGAAPPVMPPQGSGAESFSQALTSEGGSAPATGAGMMTGSKKAVVPFAEINVEKAPGENSYSVGEIFSKAAELNGKTVVVRGKVMKVSPRIMGRNWIHLQDGTGSPDENTHDLVVTTSQDPEADWDIITMEGVLTANKDFGSGYSYVVIIEEANIKQ